MRGSVARVDNQQILMKLGFFTTECLTYVVESVVCRPRHAKPLILLDQNTMANSNSAKKRIRQIKKRTERNRTLESRVKTYRKKTLAAAEAGDKDAANAAFKKFASAVDKCVKKNIFHANKGANLKSKTNKAIVAA